MAGTWHRKRRFLCFLIGSTLVRCKNSKTVTYFLLGFSSLRRGVFGTAWYSKWPDNIFRTMVFRYFNKKVALNIFCSSLLSFVPEIPHMDQRTTSKWSNRVQNALQYSTNKKNVVKICSFGFKKNNPTIIANYNHYNHFILTPCNGAFTVIIKEKIY